MDVKPDRIDLELEEKKKRSVKQLSSVAPRVQTCTVFDEAQRPQRKHAKRFRGKRKGGAIPIRGHHKHRWGQGNKGPRDRGASAASLPKHYSIERPACH